MSVTKRKSKRSVIQRRRYRGYVEQINQVCLEVLATDPDEAAEKIHKKWRRECAHATIGTIEVVPRGRKIPAKWRKNHA